MKITEEQYNALKIKYEEAVNGNKEIFMFQGQEIVTVYAKYLLQHLKGKK